jgi:hypothetical protein
MPTCSRCHNDKAEALFAEKKNGSRYKTCTPCRETKKVQGAKYRALKREELRAKGRAYYATHKPQKKAYELANKERIKAYRKANKEHISKRRKAYYKANKERIQQHVAQRWWMTKINSTRHSDKKKGLYSEEHHIDKEFLVAIREEQKNRCIYCSIAMVSYNPEDPEYTALCSNGLSVERKDNNLGHTKDNVVLACIHCNAGRKNKHSFEEFYRLKAGERIINE